MYPLTEEKLIGLLPDLPIYDASQWNHVFIDAFVNSAIELQELFLA